MKQICHLNETPSVDGHRFRSDRKIVRELSFSLSEITPSSIASNRLALSVAPSCFLGWAVGPPGKIAIRWKALANGFWWYLSNG